MFSCPIIIPARYGSTRFPGKPLHLIAGKPLVQHVWERCRQVSLADGVIIATDDERISRAVRDFGAEVVMTRDDHPSGTDRLAEVAGISAPVFHADGRIAAALTLSMPAHLYQKSLLQQVLQAAQNLSGRV